jgi:sec-independent protein translocase protein TatB
MFDIGGLELLVIVVVALVAIGPKELPGAIRTGMTWMRKTRALAHEFQSGLEELSREAGMHELRREVEEAANAEELQNIARGFERDLADDETRRILGDPETKKLLEEVENGSFYGSPPEEPELAEAPKPVTEAPPGATGS